MNPFQEKFKISTGGKGAIEITDTVDHCLQASGITDGQLTVFCRHTSCSLVIMENADPSAWVDLESWIERLVDENDPDFTHTLEGVDDMPSHIKMALTRTSETIPVSSGRMVLGTWQGLFLWEHRSHPHERELVVSILGV